MWWLWFLYVDFYCKCGCGKEVKFGNKYIIGHNGRGKISWNAGKKSSEETRKKISLSGIGRMPWNIGKSPSTETRGKMSLAKIGKHHSIETREKMSLSRTGEKNYNFGKSLSIETKKKISIAKSGENHPNFGKHHSIETKKKISFSTMGENSSQWRGGIDNIPYGPGNTKKLKEQIRIRDNYTCQECSKIWDRKERKFAPHHIDYCKNNHSFWNRITLCSSCHSTTNTNREYWQEKFTLFLLAKYNRLVL